MSETRKIALFGGTFDPVHCGHLRMAEAARERLMLDEVRFLPCRISPHKAGTAPTAAVDRVAMLRLATRELPWAVVDEFEAMREGLSFSWQTAEEMKARFPDARLFWIMGTDQWEVLPTWAEPQRLAACVEFIVFTRGEAPQPREGYRMHPVDGVIHPASATKIREGMDSKSFPKKWLHPEVAAFIVERGLYQK
jgi:nicotinate-nucleotide adenylyltransferase